MLKKNDHENTAAITKKNEDHLLDIYPLDGAGNGVHRYCSAVEK